MIPIRDQNPTSSTPYMTILLIMLNMGVFFYQAWGPGGADRMIWKYGYVPAELVQGSAGFAAHLREHPIVEVRRDAQGRPLRYVLTGRPVLQVNTVANEQAPALPAWVNIFTCMFLHGGWMHLLGNMLYLWIFGNNIEDRLGSTLFTLFYLGTGVVGNLAHTLFDPGVVPLVGASGAISGVMGAYVLLFPRTRILALVPVGWYPLYVSLPAWVFLGIYFVVQNLYPATFTAGGNVAYWAHIGGFVAGAALILVFPRRRPPPQARPIDDLDRQADVVI